MKQKNNMLIDFGTAVLTFNQWTGYENRDIATYFHQATRDEIRNLKNGDVIWLDEDPIHPNGKVYGFVKKKVTRKEGDKIHFGDGFITLHHKIFIVDDEKDLAELIDTDPRITDVVGESGHLAAMLLAGRD